MEYIEVEFADWPVENDNSEVARLKENVKEMERKLRAQEDYTELLIRYMARRDLYDEGSDRCVSWWHLFAYEYPIDAAALNQWIEKRHAD